MKTNKSRTKCLEKSRTFMSKFRTFASNRHDSDRKKPLCNANLPICTAFSPVFLCIIRPISDFGIAVQQMETAMLEGPEYRAAAA